MNVNNVSFGATMRPRDVRMLKRQLKQAMNAANTKEEFNKHMESAKNLVKFLKDINQENGNNTTVYLPKNRLVDSLYLRFKKDSSLNRTIDTGTISSVAMREEAASKVLTPELAEEIKRVEAEQTQLYKTKNAAKSSISKLFRKN